MLLEIVFTTNRWYSFTMCRFIEVYEWHLKVAFESKRMREREERKKTKEKWIESKMVRRMEREENREGKEWGEKRESEAGRGNRESRRWAWERKCEHERRWKEFRWERREMCIIEERERNWEKDAKIWERGELEGREGEGYSSSSKKLMREQRVKYSPLLFVFGCLLAWEFGLLATNFLTWESESAVLAVSSCTLNWTVAQ